MLKKGDRAALLDKVMDDVEDWRQLVKDINHFEQSRTVAVSMTIRLDIPARVDTGVVSSAIPIS
jgi:hypothetical protein